MARKIKFALEMKDGVKVRSNLEELRENFDLEKAVGYFLSGKLTEWLADRYYEDEVEKLEAIDKDAPDLRARLCEALGVECEDEAELDVEQLVRLNEKKAVLRQKTSDEYIIANADKTALTQEDLADLLDMDESVIYLCGDSFNVPARIKNKKYVGVLGTPTISIKANSRKELDEKGIVFENVKLPWGEQKAEVTDGEKKSCPKCGAGNATTAKFCNSCGAALAIPNTQSVAAGGKWIVPKEQMKMIFSAAFKEELDRINGNIKNGNSKVDVNDKFLMFDGIYGDTFISKNLTQDQKNLALSFICDDKYAESDLVQLRIREDMTAGWAFTNDSFCIKAAADKSTVIIPYESIVFDWRDGGLGQASGILWPSKIEESERIEEVNPDRELGRDDDFFAFILMVGELYHDEGADKFLKNINDLFKKKKR